MRPAKKTLNPISLLSLKVVYLCRESGEVGLELGDRRLRSCHYIVPYALNRQLVDPCPSWHDGAALLPVTTGGEEEPKAMTHPHLLLQRGKLLLQHVLRQQAPSTHQWRTLDQSAPALVYFDGAGVAPSKRRPRRPPTLLGVGESLGGCPVTQSTESSLCLPDHPEL